MSDTHEHSTPTGRLRYVRYGGGLLSQPVLTLQQEMTIVTHSNTVKTFKGMTYSDTLDERVDWVNVPIVEDL
jgi:hypothetical protein